MVNTKERDAVKKAAEKVDRDYRTFLNYIQKNSLKMTANGNLGKKTCFDMNQEFVCIPENYDKPSMFQKRYKEITFFHDISLYMGFYYLTGKDKGLKIVSTKRLDRFMELDAVSRYGILLAVYLQDYLNVAEADDELYEVHSAIYSMRESTSGNYLNEYGNEGKSFYPLKDIKLLKLFGLVEIVEVQEKELRGKYGYQKATDIGCCLARRLDFVNMWEEEDTPAESLFRQMEPVFHDGRADIEFLFEPIIDNIEKTFCLEISVGRCIRRIKISGMCTLEYLHNYIQEIIKFDNDHMYYFEIGYGGAKERFFHPYSTEGIPADEVILGELTLTEGMKFLYLFDFGDSWKFGIKVEAITEEKIEGAVLVESKGRAPKQYPM